MTLAEVLTCTHEGRRTIFCRQFKLQLNNVLVVAADTTYLSS
jgi:predicted YcjX-like family ATPase